MLPLRGIKQLFGCPKGAILSVHLDQNDYMTGGILGVAELKELDVSHL